MFLQNVLFVLYYKHIMKPLTLLFIGRSGAGKGTQAELLKNYFTAQNQEVKSITGGDVFRAFFKEDGYIQKIAKDLSMNQGKFQPDFLTDALCISYAARLADEHSHLLFDAYPRTPGQLVTFKQFLEYIKRENAIIVNVEVSPEEVTRRMLSRGRGDDSESAIKSRLGEYDRTVIPMLEEINKDPFFIHLEIDGSRSINEIHEDIKNKLAPYLA